MKAMAGALVLLALLALRCSEGPVATDDTGNGSETGNTICGRFLDEAGSPVSGAKVYLYPVDYVPSFSLPKKMAVLVDTTDSEGRYAIPSPDSGCYNVEGKRDTLGAFIDSVDVPDDTSGADVGDAVMKRAGVITGICHMVGQNDTNQIRVVLYMPGTGRITMPVIGGRFGFDHVPHGSFQVLINPTLSEYNVRVIDTSITPGETLDLDTVFIDKQNPDTIDIITASMNGEWGPNKVYRINNDIRIPQGASLTINPGVHVVFMGPYCIEVDGTLNATGTSDAMIVFTYGLSNPQPGSWVGINPNIITPDTLVMKYCVLEYARESVASGYTDAASYVDISNCVFRYTDVGVNTRHDGMVIANCVFQDIRLYNSYGCAIMNHGNTDIVIVNNIFLDSRCFYGPQDLYETSSIYYNDFFGCDTIGIDYPTVWTLGVGGNNLYDDPAIVGMTPGQEDYHLQPGSPCRGAGIYGTDIGVYSTFQASDLGDTVDINTTAVTGTWGPDRVYRVLTSIEIPRGGSLTILPGTKVLVMGNLTIENYGTLLSIGDSGKPIGFDYGLPSGYWQGISCRQGDSTHFRHTVFERASNAVYIISSDYVVNILNCVVRKSKIGFIVHNLSKHANLYNNVIHDLDDNPDGLELAVNLSTASRNYDVFFRNNVIANCYTGIRRSFYSSNNVDVNIVLEYNCLFNNSQTNFVFRDQNGGVETPYTPTHTGEVSSNPLFVSLTAPEDYHLQPGSPCIGTGVNGTDMGIYSTYEP